MNVTSEYELLDGLHVTVDRLDYLDRSEQMGQWVYRFVYYITIHNDSQRVVTIVGRKWVVTNSHGHKMIVEGDGVVGQFPRLMPGDQFHYNSFHLIEADSVAEGAYLGRDEQGQGVLTRIPRFELKIPSILD